MSQERLPTYETEGMPSKFTAKQPTSSKISREDAPFMHSQSTRSLNSHLKKSYSEYINHLKGNIKGSFGQYTAKYTIVRIFVNFSNRHTNRVFD